MSSSSLPRLPNCLWLTCLWFAGLWAATMVGAGVQAQDNSATDTRDANTRIDILAEAGEMYGPQPPVEDCSEEQEAAIISGEIIVCRRVRDQSAFRTTDRDSAADRYARETAYANDPQAPDVAGAGIFRGPASVGGLCLIPPCPKEPALIIDVAALPEAPPGSDADRIARGLPPLGNEQGGDESEAQLGLPQNRPEFESDSQQGSNSAESEEPVAVP